MTSRFFLSTAVGWVLILFATLARADEYDGLKQTVQLRAGTIQELKDRGAMREGPGGFLLPGPRITPEQQRVLDDENADRGRLFAIIAVRTGRSSEEIASAFEGLASARSPKHPAQPPLSPTSEPPVAPIPSQSTADPVPSAPVASARSKALPMKVITRPLASVYADADSNARRIRENTPAFTIYYVYQKRDGWYEIGEDSLGKPLGWLKADDAVEWKQNLVVEFTHPEGRQPVLMFEKLAALESLVRAPRTQRSVQANDYYKTIDSGRIPRDFPIRTMEPRRAVKSQSREQFYLLPIVDHKPTELDGREGRLLQIASATRKRGESSLLDSEERTQLTRATDLRALAARGVQVDLVFVMDLTRSMGPFADRTIEMIEQCVNKIGADKEVVEAVRFGFWGYRDFPESCRGIGFNTHNYTPDLQPLNEFARTLKNVQETKVDSVDYEEDVFAGVADAIDPQKTRWRNGSIRMLVLVGDAPGRAPGATGVGYPNGPRGTRSGTDAESLRGAANAAQVYISAIYLNSPKWARFSELGAAQFRTLARNPNSRPGEENFTLLNATDTHVYGPTALALAEELVENIRFAQGRGGSDPSRVDVLPSGELNTPEQGATAGRLLARNMFRGAMVEWLGTRDAASVPRDVTAWAADKDLLDPAIQSLEVQVFLTKSELNTLKLVMDSVLNAGIHQRITGKDFFNALQAVVAYAANEPAQMRDAETLAKTGLVPEFLKDLPYQSTVMGMNNESWARMSPDAQDQFLNTVLAKLRYYQLVHDNSERWVALNEGDDRDNWVAAIPLEQLP